MPDFTKAVTIGNSVETVNLNSNETLTSLNDQGLATVVNAASVNLNTAAANGAITFGGTVNDANAVPTNALVLTAGTGVISLPVVGNAKPLANLSSTTTGAGSTTLNGNVSASARAAT